MTQVLGSTKRAVPKAVKMLYMDEPMNIHEKHIMFSLIVYLASTDNSFFSSLQSFNCRYQVLTLELHARHVLSYNHFLLLFRLQLAEFLCKPLLKLFDPTHEWILMQKTGSYYDLEYFGSSSYLIEQTVKIIGLKCFLPLSFAMRLLVCLVEKNGIWLK